MKMAVLCEDIKTATSTDNWYPFLVFFLKINHVVYVSSYNKQASKYKQVSTNSLLTVLSRNWWKITYLTRQCCHTREDATNPIRMKKVTLSPRSESETRWLYFHRPLAENLRAILSTTITFRLYSGAIYSVVSVARCCRARRVRHVLDSTTNYLTTRATN